MSGNQASGRRTAEKAKIICPPHPPSGVDIITNGEAVSHHYSYDSEAEKEMGSTMKTVKTKKILGLAMAKSGRAGRRGSVPKFHPDATRAFSRAGAETRL